MSTPTFDLAIRAYPSEGGYEACRHLQQALDFDRKRSTTFAELVQELVRRIVIQEEATGYVHEAPSTGDAPPDLGHTTCTDGAGVAIGPVGGAAVGCLPYRVLTADEIEEIRRKTAAIRARRSGKTETQMAHAEAGKVTPAPAEGPSHPALEMALLLHVPADMRPFFRVSVTGTEEAALVSFGNSKGSEETFRGKLDDVVARVAALLDEAVKWCNETPMTMTCTPREARGMEKKTHLDPFDRLAKSSAPPQEKP